MSWTAYRKNDIVQIDINAKARKNWEQWVLLRSDAHWDNAKSDRALQREHLDQAVERNAIVLDGGDLFCAMQGKYDHRSSKSAVRPEHNRSQYLDALVSTAAKWHQPYAKQFAMLAHGNHETAIINRHETDLTARLAEQLGCIAMPITGFVRFRFVLPSQFFGYLLHYHHGYGGGGPVTRDVIQTNRKAALLSNADISWSGHTHDAWSLAHPRVHVTNDGFVRNRQLWHIKTPTYKDDYAAGKSSWANIKGHPPKPLGCQWLRFFFAARVKGGIKNSRRIHFQVIPDIRENVLDAEGR